MLDVRTDAFLDEAPSWAEVKLLSPPPPTASPMERREWDEAIRYESPFGRGFERDGKQHRRLDGRYRKDVKWERMRKVAALTGEFAMWCGGGVEAVRLS